MKRPSTEPPRSMRQLSKQLRISRAKLWRAVQVSNIPKEEFEALVESDNPPTVTQLVELGRKRSGTKETATNSKNIRALKRAWVCSTPEEREAFVDWTNAKGK